MFWKTWTDSTGIYQNKMIKLNLGCGLEKLEGYINIDNDPSVEPDVLYDIANDGLELWLDDSIDEIRAYDFLEHIPLGRTIFVLDEIWRVLKHDGKFEHYTPSTDGRGAFQDPTHLSFWNINSWYYYCPEMVGGKRFYNIKARFKIERLTDHKTDKHVIHTHGIMMAVKNDE